MTTTTTQDETPMQSQAAQSLTAQSLATFVERTGGLYSLPGVAMEVLELTKDPQVDAQKLKACIERDAALTVRLLRVVNSSLFGLSREVSDLGQAVAILGAKPLKLLVLGFSLPDALFAGLAQDVLSAYWHNTLCKAVAARTIGDRYFNGRGGEGLIVGLLQDVGLLVLLQQLQRPFVEFVEKANEAGVDLLSAERKSLGFDHTQLTRRMLDNWRLPESIALAVEADPDDKASFSPQASSLHEIVRAAGLLSRVLIDKRPDTLQQLLQLSSFRHLPFQELRALVAELADQVKQLADVLNVSWSTECDYEKILMESQEQMASSSEDVLLDLVKSREEALAAQYDSAQLWSAYSQPKPVGQGETYAAHRSPPQSTPSLNPESAPIDQRSQEHPSSETTLTSELTAALATAVSASRQERSATSLLLVSVEKADAILFAGEMHAAEMLERCVCGAGDKMQNEPLACVPLAGNVFALVVPHCERRGAVQDAHNVLAHVRRSLTSKFAAAVANVSLAAGVASVALPHKHFQGNELFDAALRCVQAAQLAGADGVKSIEIY
ncbi:MAG: HDOD domain-containing protein [Pirellulales bacterium]|nr:HDOD domain-containing protein [Pirellulales bacterium]